MKNNTNNTPKHKVEEIIKAMLPMDNFADNFIKGTKSPNRVQLFKEFLTKPNLLYRNQSKLLDSYYFKTVTVAEMIKLANGSKGNYYSFFSPLTDFELINASNIIIHYRDAIKELNIPPIALVLVRDYYPIIRAPITELRIL